MARGRAVRSCDRGGEVVQALHATRPRLIAVTAALAVAGALAAYPTLKAGSLAPLAGAIGILAIGLLGIALLGFDGALPWALALFGVGYTVIDVARPVPLAAAPLYGAGLLLAAELVYAARELESGVEEHVALRVPWLAGVGAAAVAAGLVPVAAAAVSGPGGVAGAIVAAALSGALLAAPVILLRRQSTRAPG